MMIERIYIDEHADGQFKYMCPNTIMYALHSVSPCQIGGYGLINCLYHQLVIRTSTLHTHPRRLPRLEQYLEECIDDPIYRKTFSEYVHMCNAISTSKLRNELLQQIPIQLLLVGISEDLGNMLTCDSRLSVYLSSEKLVTNYDPRWSTFIVGGEITHKVEFHQNVTITTTLYHLIEHLKVVLTDISSKPKTYIQVITINDFYRSIARYIYDSFPDIADDLLLSFENHITIDKKKQKNKRMK